MFSKTSAFVLLLFFSLSFALRPVNAKPFHKKKAPIVAVCAVALVGISGLLYLPQYRVNALPSANSKLIGTASKAPVLPKTFEIFENAISFSDTFTVHNDEQRFGLIKEKIFSLSKSFWFENADGVVIAEAKESLLSWGTEIKVYDGNGALIGEIHEKVFNSLFKVKTSYTIRNSKGEKIAQSEKVDWVSTSFTIKDKDGRTLLKMDRPWMSFPADRWSVRLYDSEIVDPRLSLMIAAYKSSVDNDRSSSSSDDD